MRIARRVERIARKDCFRLSRVVFRENSNYTNCNRRVPSGIAGNVSLRPEIKRTAERRRGICMGYVFSRRLDRRQITLRKNTAKFAQSVDRVFQF